MNILIVSQYYWPENFRINELSLELMRLGHNVTVLTGYPNYPTGKILKEFLNDKQKYSYYKGVKIIRVPIFPRGNTKLQLIINYVSFVFSATFIGIFKLLKFKFDNVFVFQTSPIFVGIPSSIIAFIKKASQIIWVLDLWPETLSAVGIIKRKWQIKTLRIIVNIIYSRCDLILTQSKSFIKEIKKYQNKKVLYFPAWTESVFMDSTKNPAQEITLNTEKFTLIFAGNIGDAQDFPSIIKAADYLIKNKFHKFRIIIIGEGSKKNWLIKEVKNRDLSENFQILKQYPLERMPSFFAHADALLVSLLDSRAFEMVIPGKIQSYLSTGIPLIGMLNGEAAKVIKESNSGYVCNAGDYKELADLIIKMSQLSKKDRKILGRNGKEFAIKEFNKESLMIKLEKLIKKIKKK